MSRQFLSADIPELVKKLRTDEKIALLSGPDWWNTTSIPRLAIPSIRMSDGPNGVRGSSHFVSTPAQCLPCATALASTFDTELVNKVGKFLAQEAKVKSAVVLLAPTCNIQRSPLGGRAFESFSEDPHLSGHMAAAYINGLQSEGVAATIKHFVGNDQEHERTAAESIISDRALREIYLYPFMLAQKYAQPRAYMTSYGRIHGVHCSENPELLQGILRSEWKFRGIVISDWYGTYGVSEPINAGLDLEMPGPPRWRTPLLVNHCLTAQKLLMPTLDERVTNFLHFVQQQARASPDIVYGDGKEGSRDSPDTRQFCRKLAADGIVLLKNETGVLPFSPDRIKKLAVIGPNATERVISGGGSAALKPTYVVTPLDGIKAAAYSGLSVDYELGCYAHKYLPTIESHLMTPNGDPGWLCTFYSHDEHGCLSDPVADFVLNDTRVKLNDFLPSGLTDTWSLRLTGKLTVETTGPFELGLTVAGRAKLWIDGQLTIDNWTKQTPGDFFYGQGTIEEKTTVELQANRAYDVLVEYINTVSSESGNNSAQPALMRGVRLGGCRKVDAEEAMLAAIQLASQSDAVVLVVGLTPEWESEGFDRPSLQLPGPQDELIARIAEVNPNTVVCIQAGSAVSIPAIHDINALLQTWYLGNETGNAIADVLFGKTNPCGRLPLTLPVCIEDVPSFLNLRSENGKIYYREDLYVGYKHYQARNIKPMFPFGFGLSYSQFMLIDSVMEKSSFHDDSLLVKINLTIKNTSQVIGSQVIQLYVSYPNLGLTQPPLQLKGFSKVHDMVPGATCEVSLELDKYAFSFWDELNHTWRVEKGKYGLNLGFSVENILVQHEYEICTTFSWKGL